MNKNLDALFKKAEQIVTPPIPWTVNASFAAYLLTNGCSLDKAVLGYLKAGRDAISAYRGIIELNQLWQYKLLQEGYEHPSLSVVEAMYKAGYPANQILIAIYEGNTQTPKDRKEVARKVLLHLNLPPEEIEKVLRSQIEFRIPLLYPSLLFERLLH